MGEGNVIFAWQFKDAHYMWGQNAIFTWQFKDAYYMWEREMQYLKDDVKDDVMFKGIVAWFENTT